MRGFLQVLATRHAGEDRNLEEGEDAEESTREDAQLLVEGVDAGGEEGDDGDDHQEFNEREGAADGVGFRHGTCRGLGVERRAVEQCQRK